VKQDNTCKASEKKKQLNSLFKCYQMWGREGGRNIQSCC